METVRINFIDEVDEDLLIRIALKEGFRVERGSFAPRIVEKDAIVARIGSRSDFGGRFDLYIYPFPPEIERLSMYRRVLASRRGLINSKTGRANLEKIHEFNLRIIRLVNSYIKEKYF
ncbi:TPA: hypothetical protein EYP70_00760 [Candidatus Bathyarchaeota archaeon]|nr:hypothetical protein [Candidatus Bathyarchaeota archaeon]